MIFTFEGTILRYVRGAKSGEKRLVDKASIGIGGHINDSDESLFSFDKDAYRAAVHREVAEELKFEGMWEDRLAALINDDSTESGKSILALCMWSRCATPPFAPGRRRSASSAFSRPKNSGNSETNSNHGRKLCWTPGKRCSVPTMNGRSTSALWRQEPWPRLLWHTPLTALAIFVIVCLIAKRISPFRTFRCMRVPVRNGDTSSSRMVRVSPSCRELNGCHCVASW